MKSWSWPATTLGMVTEGNSGCPQADMLVRHAEEKRWATTATAGRPAFSTATVSWASHDVHPPQSAVVPMTPSHSRAMRSTSSSDATVRPQPMEPV